MQILSRHWKIADSNGKTQEIVGDGLVGQKPTLMPGETFDYSSGTPLKSPSGFMSGIFHAISEKYGRFKTHIPSHHVIYIRAALKGRTGKDFSVEDIEKALVAEGMSQYV